MMCFSAVRYEDFGQHSDRVDQQETPGQAYTERESSNSKRVKMAFGRLLSKIKSSRRISTIDDGSIVSVRFSQRPGSTGHLS